MLADLPDSNVALQKFTVSRLTEEGQNFGLVATEAFQQMYLRKCFKLMHSLSKSWDTIIYIVLSLQRSVEIPPAIVCSEKF